MNSQQWIVISENEFERNYITLIPQLQISHHHQSQISVR